MASEAKKIKKWKYVPVKKEIKIKIPSKEKWKDIYCQKIIKIFKMNIKSNNINFLKNKEISKPKINLLRWQKDMTMEKILLWNVWYEIKINNL